MHRAIAYDKSAVQHARFTSPWTVRAIACGQKSRIFASTGGDRSAFDSVPFWVRFHALCWNGATCDCPALEGGGRPRFARSGGGDSGRAVAVPFASPPPRLASRADPPPPGEGGAEYAVRSNAIALARARRAPRGGPARASGGAGCQKEHH